MKKIDRNAPCPCGSGKKYKQCCLKRDEATASSNRAESASIQKTLQTALEHHHAGRLSQAEALYQQILQISPDHPDALHFLGVIAHQMGKNELAIELIGKSLSLKPDVVEAHNNIGLALHELGKLEEAVAHYQKALSIKSDYADAHSNLGYVLQAQGNLDEAISHYHRALALKPDFADAHNHLGVALQTRGFLDQAIQHYRKALSNNPGAADTHSNLLFALNFHPDLSKDVVFRAAQEYEAQRGIPLRCTWPAHGNDRNPHRRLRVGYVSPDFYRHAVALFAEPILANHDKSQVEIFCYAEVIREDEVTDRFRRYADHWHSTVGLSDDAVAQMILGHQIDILVDLAGHTAHNRLLVFARKPAPIQLTYLGYPGTTGLSAMDYRITDHYADPDGIADAFYSEQLVRLPGSLWCYRPSADMPDVSPLPALTRGYLTFGSFNNFNKIDQATLELWAELLLALPASRLMMLTVPEGEARQHLINRFEKLGISAQRLEFHGKLPAAEFHRKFLEVDICLDPLTVNGATTTCESLWMGVPVISLVGERFLTRAGLSVLSTAGLTDFAAASREDYIHIAQHLADNLPLLAEIRAGLREHVRTSPLVDEVGFTRNLESCYREIWKKWCQTNQETVVVNKSCARSIPVSPSIQTALEHHQAGQLTQAEAIYQQILQAEPNHVDALHLLGVIAHQTGQNELAVELIGKALLLKPDFVDAHNNIGLALHQLGNLTAAVEHYRKALAIRPNNADAHSNLGFALQIQGKLDRAIQHLQKALALKPDFPDAHNHFGVVLQQQGKLDEAISHFQKALLLKPDFVDAHFNLGRAFQKQANLDAALECYNKVLTIQPGHAENHFALAGVFQAQGKSDAAERHYRQTLLFKPDHADAHYNLGVVLDEQGKDDAATESYRQALILKPDFAEALNNLGNALSKQNKLDEAIESFQHALMIRPDFAEAHNNLGNAFKDQGRLGEAVECYRKALASKPDYSAALSNLLYALNFLPDMGRGEVYRASLEFETLNGSPLRPIWPVHSNNTNPHRRLRIGYVSPDFRNHAVASFAEPILSNHDKLQVEVFCYADVAREDEVTRRFRRYADHWYSIVGLSDAATAQMIQNHHIDILVDLAGHTAKNRLLAFARKPAPIQLTYLGYPGTTGLSAMDFRLTDHYADPDGIADEFYSEHLLRLPGSLWCYRPNTNMPEMSPLPALARGYLTFGSFNNFNKIDLSTLELWAELLKLLPTSRLMMLTIPEGKARQNLLRQFAQLGINAERLEFYGRLPEILFIQKLLEVDITLDPINVNGATTTCESLWMGVPVLSLVGERFLSRAGLSILSAAGLSDFAATSREDYLRIANHFADNLPQLAEIRASLRERLRTSSLVDEVGFTRNLECLYRKVWSKWCGSSQGATVVASNDVEVDTDSISRSMQSALEHHHAGRLSQAEVCYQQILQTASHHQLALRLSGVLAHQLGRVDTAVELYGKALNAYPDDALCYNNLGNALKDQGKLDEAVENYQKALSIQPDFIDALYNLGNTLKAQSKLDAALESYHKVLLLQPDNVETLNNLGLVLHAQGKHETAIKHYRHALSLKPDSAPVHCNLGTALQSQGELDAAVESFERALSLKPDYADAFYNLGNVLRAQGKLDAAIGSYSKALALQPDNAEIHNNLGSALLAQGKLNTAIDHFLKAISIKSNFAEAYNNLGCALKDQGKLDEAIERQHKALLLKPDFVEAYCNIGFTLHLQGRLGEAVEFYHKALSILPDDLHTHNNLGLTLQSQGKLDEAVEHYRKVLSIKPDHADVYSNLLFLLAYHSLLDPHEYLVQARNWEQKNLPAQDRQTAHNRTFSRSLPVGRRLRVGYVSGDFRQHAVSYFIEQLFAHHDKSQIELFAYSNYAQCDSVTERLKALVDHWIPLTGIPDAVACERIAADEIDVLIDLSGHTNHNRLGIFARRAAPVQAHYLGYFASTGLSEMDYWIGDEILTPPITDSHFSEHVWRLPRVWISYDGKTDAPIPNWRPDQSGTLWLGSFNNLSKLTPATLSLWARTLHALPESKLLLKTKELADTNNRQRVLNTMSGYGVSLDRIELQDGSATQDWRNHMAYYDRLDIALDPIGAVGGGTTTCDALWMGVPVIAMEGDRMASRMTAAMLNAIGHPEWVVHTEAEYIDKVVALARDNEQRKALRPNQRERMVVSPLCDAKDLARSLESAYFEMFRRWVDEKAERNDLCLCASGKKFNQCCPKSGEAIDARKSAEPVSVPAVFQEAIAHHQTGHLSQADSLYQQILEVEPSHHDALHLLGVVAHQAGNDELAVELISKAIRVNPANPMCYMNLGNALKDLGQLDAAADSYRQALVLKPDFAEARSNLEMVLKEQKFHAEVNSYRNTLPNNTGLDDVHNSHGIVFQHNGLGVPLERTLDHAFYPRVPAISLELTNNCNLKCPYCANGTLTRPKTYIGWSLLEKIVDECAEMQYNLAWLHGVGEPLLWDRLEEVVALIKRKGAGAGSFGTNGTLLYPDRVKRLLDAGLDSIYVSIDTLDPEIYKNTRGGKLEKVIHNIQEMIKIVPNSFQITVALMNHKDHHVTGETIKQFHQIFGVHENVRTNLVENQLFPSAPGDYRLDANQKIQNCFSPINYLFIALDGRAAICCMDQDVLHSLGNVADRSIHDVWFDLKNQTAFRNIALGVFECPDACVRRCVLLPPRQNINTTSLGLGLPFDDAARFADILLQNDKKLIAASVFRDMALRDPANLTLKAILDELQSQYYEI